MVGKGHEKKNWILKYETPTTDKHKEHKEINYN